MGMGPPGVGRDNPTHTGIHTTHEYFTIGYRALATVRAIQGLRIPVRASAAIAV